MILLKRKCERLPEGDCGRGLFGEVVWQTEARLWVLGGMSQWGLVVEAPAVGYWT